jgi:hypothetical protein
MVIINVRLSLYACNNPRVPRALVAGGFLLVKREVYHALGGHASVKWHVVEDVALGTRAKALGRRVFTALTHDLYTARMFEGWRDTFRGLKKNAYAGANYSLLFAVFITFFMLFVGVVAPVYALGGIILACLHPSAWTFILAVAGITACAGQLAAGVRTARFIGMPIYVALTLPASFAFYLAVFIGSVMDYYRGGNMWAGRRIVNAQTLAEAGKVT